jgi:hypothetical protein
MDQVENPFQKSITSVFWPCETRHKLKTSNDFVQLLTNISMSKFKSA